MAPLKPRWPAHVSGTSPPMQGATCGVHKESDPWTSEIDPEIGCWNQCQSWAFDPTTPSSTGLLAILERTFLRAAPGLALGANVSKRAEQSESYHPSNDVAKPTVNHLQEQSRIRCFVDIGFATSVFKDGSRNRRWFHDDYFKKKKAG